MPYTIESNDANRRRVERLRARARDLMPVTRRAALWVEREARRRAPRGKFGRRSAGLAASLSHAFPIADRGTSFVLTSDKPYARIQQFGGTVTAGGGKLGARMLAIPLNDKARRMLSKMGASTSLRSQDLTLIRTKGGKLLLARTFKYKKMRLSKAERGTARRRGIRTRRTQRKPEFLFVLKESVTLAPNPPPRGYAPRADEPEYSDFVAKELREHLRGVA